MLKYSLVKADFYAAIYTYYLAAVYLSRRQNMLLWKACNVAMWQIFGSILNIYDKNIKTCLIKMYAFFPSNRIFHNMSSIENTQWYKHVTMWF